MLTGIQQVPERHRQPEVQHDDSPVPAHEHVRGLDVAVQHAAAMQCVHAIGELAQRVSQAPFIHHVAEGHAPGGFNGRAAAVAHVAEEVHAVDQLHREEPAIPLGHELVKRHEVGVDHGGQRSELVLETEKLVRVHRREHLQRDVRARRILDGLVDHAHAARAKFADDGVTPSPERGRLAAVSRQTRP